MVGAGRRPGLEVGEPRAARDQHPEQRLDDVLDELGAEDRRGGDDDRQRHRARRRRQLDGERGARDARPAAVLPGVLADGALVEQHDAHRPTLVRADRQVVADRAGGGEVAQHLGRRRGRQRAGRDSEQRGADVRRDSLGGEAETAADTASSTRRSGRAGRRERGRLVAPVLAQGVGEQPVRDRPTSGRLACRRVLTQAWSMFQSSVISWSSKIISDGTFASTRPHVRKRLPGRAATFARSSSHDSLLTPGSTSGGMGAGPVGNGGSVCRPQHGRPRQQVHGHELAVGPQVVGGRAGVAERVRARAAATDRWGGSEHVGLVDADEVLRHAQHPRHQRMPHLVGVDLVAGHHQEVRLTLRRRVEPRRDVHRGDRQAVAAATVRLAARRVVDDEIGGCGRRREERRARRLREREVGSMRSGRGRPPTARSTRTRRSRRPRTLRHPGPER